MTTSSDYSFLSNENDIINDAFTKIGIHFPGETIPAENYDFARRQLNRMIKFWARNQHLWIMRAGTLLLENGVNTYTLDSTAARWTDTMRDTTLTAAGAALATSLTVASTTGMTVGDAIGVILTSKVIHWTTIATIPNATSLTITTGLATAAANGNRVYTYTTRAQPPIRIEWIVRRSSDDIDVELAQLSRKDYDTLPSKTLAGLPVAYYYDPKITNGTLYLYQTPDDPKVTLQITYRRQIQDMDTTTQTIEFPIEWEDCIVHNLAIRLAPLGGIGLDDPLFVQIQQIAVDELRSLAFHDDDNMSMQLDIDDTGD